MHGQPIAVTLIGNAPTEKLQLSVQTPATHTNLLQPAKTLWLVTRCQFV